VVVVDGDADLLEVVGAGGAGGGLAHFLHSGQQQPDQHGDDRDDDEQLDQRERGAGFRPRTGRVWTHGWYPFERMDSEYRVRHRTRTVAC
jgi:hypothetical protein